MRTKVSLILMAAMCFGGGCGTSTPTTATGVTKATATVTPGADGLTTEQRNIGDRLALDNKPGSIKHLYVISAYSGQTIIYSTVRGKVTSSSKRLSPTRVSVFGTETARSRGGFDTGIGGTVTDEVLQDDGTYGASVDYLYWWDTRGIYHQHYVSGGQIVHISDQPLAVKSVIINMELTDRATDNP